MRGPFKSAENPPMIDGCQDNNDNNTSATPVAHERDASYLEEKEAMSEKGPRRPSVKKRGSVSSLGSHEVKAKETTGKTKDSISTVSYMDEPGHHEDHARLVQMENTYHVGPSKRFPVQVVTDILKDVLSSYLQEEKYDAELCRQMTKTISEVVKARVKELMIPRYKLVVLISIGQLGDQSMYVGSRCLWDAANDTFATHAFKNASLLAVASVYAVYFE